MYKNSFLGMGLNKPILNIFNKTYVLVVIAVLLSPLNLFGIDLNPQKEFNMKNDWKIISYGFDKIDKKFIANAKLSFKDNLNGVMLKVITEPSDFGKVTLQINKTIDGGFNWDSLIYIRLPSTAAVYDIAYINNNVIFLESEVRNLPSQLPGITKLWLSNNEGLTWNYIELDYFEEGNGLDYHNTKIIIANDSTYFILYRFNLIKTGNYGRTWVNLTNNIQWNEAESKHRISDIEFYKNNLYLSTFDRLNEIKYSNNLGDTWMSIVNNGTLPWFTNDLIIINEENFLVLSGLYNNSIKSWKDTIMITKDSGFSWDTLDANLFPDHYQSVVCEKNGFLFVRSPQYIYNLDDTSDQIKNIGGDKFSEEYFIDYDDAEYFNNRVIFIDKYYGNVWLYTFPNTRAKEKYSLPTYSFYPNPLPHSAPLNVNLKNIGLYTNYIFKVIDINGKTIDEFSVNRDRADLIFQYLPNVNIPSGLYFLIVESDGNVIAKEKFVVE